MTPEQHKKLCKVVRGAVRDAMNMHPDYLTDKGRKSMVGSIEKRLVGQLVSLVNGEGRQCPTDAEVSRASGSTSWLGALFAKLRALHPKWSAQ